MPSPVLLTHLSARVGDEALQGDGLPRSREGRLSEALHERVDDCHGDLVPLLHFIQDLHRKGPRAAWRKGMPLGEGQGPRV